MHPKFRVANDNLADLKGDIDAGIGKLTGPSITKPSGQPQTLETLPSRRRVAIFDPFFRNISHVERS